jgi:hypothetical protein
MYSLSFSSIALSYPGSAPGSAPGIPPDKAAAALIGRGFPHQVKFRAPKNQ